MLEAYEVRNPVTEKLVLAFHQALTKGTYDDARWANGERPGEYKHAAYVVGMRDSGVAPGGVHKEIEALLEELKLANSDNVLTVAAYFHAVFEGIHPFADGNGRCGRALMNYLLLLHGQPPIVIFDDDKLSYYGALDICDAEEDLNPLRQFLIAETVKTWHKVAGI